MPSTSITTRWAGSITHRQYVHLRKTAFEYEMSNVVLDAEQGKTLKDVEEIISAAHSRFHCPGCYDQDCLGSDMSTKHCCVSCVLDDEIEAEIRAQRSPEANG